ncbi:hypothetical protein CcCBS67573_g04181 [Chytriomyces confervae]|uniref:Low temperature viability protein n=1 Tax=Chytriomyces confervae TaxID=246404 RepID=A0A507FDY1_9FUNG|nr:hypothetical protein CcCBS67573_g04181 [Chytriomyces confervae]
MGKKVKKFIDKSQSLTFQVVHRSQRDPAMADNDSSKLVLKPVAPSYNLLKKGKVLDMPEVDYDYEEMSDEDDEDDDEFDLEDDLDDSEYDEEVDFGREREEKEAHDHEAALQALKLAPELGQGPDGVKQAAAAVEKSSGPVDAKKDVSVFGIFFKDQKEYDYAQHLKIMGEDPNAIYIDSKKVLEQKKAEAKGKAGIKFLDDSASVAMSEVPKKKAVAFNIPGEVLASEHEDRVGMLARGETVNVIDIEPSMREIVYALDDEAYVEDDIDDFFDAFNADTVPESLSTKLDPEDYIPDQDDDEYDSEDGEGDWYDEYQRYKNQGDDSDEYEDDDESYAERRTALTNLSMTSSAMVRTKHLSNLDDQFDEALKAYDDDQVGDLEQDAFDPETDEPCALDANKPSISSERMNKIFDSFLESTEVVGRKGLVLNKVPESVKIDAVRNELRDVTRVTELMKLSVDDTMEGGDVLDAILEREVLDMRPNANIDKWDVETVLTTYSNIYNHPQMIRDVMTNTRKIRLSRRGPVVVEPKAAVVPTVDDDADEDNENDSEDGDFEAHNAGKARTKGETKEEKKARKQAVKEQKQSRRSEKKQTKEAFKKEAHVQHKSLLNKNAQDIFVPI